MMIVKFAEAAKLWVTNIRGVLNEILTDLCSPFILYRNLEDHHNCLERLTDFAKRDLSVTCSSEMYL